MHCNFTERAGRTKHSLGSQPNNVEHGQGYRQSEVVTPGPAKPVSSSCHKMVGSVAKGLQIIPGGENYLSKIPLPMPVFAMAPFKTLIFSIFVRIS